jgi:transcriptional regulator with XRE-family HTH domain
MITEMASTPKADPTRSRALEALRGNVIAKRARAHLSQVGLAKRANVSSRTISRVERAATNVRIQVVDRIANALDTTLADLLVPFGQESVGDSEPAVMVVGR